MMARTTCNINFSYISCKVNDKQPTFSKCSKNLQF